jgi:hypothetical protein
MDLLYGLDYVCSIRSPPTDFLPFTKLLAFGVSLQKSQLKRAQIMKDYLYTLVVQRRCCLVSPAEAKIIVSYFFLLLLTKRWLRFAHYIMEILPSYYYDCSGRCWAYCTPDLRREWLLM